MCSGHPFQPHQLLPRRAPLNPGWLQRTNAPQGNFRSGPTGSDSLLTGTQSSPFLLGVTDSLLRALPSSLHFSLPVSSQPGCLPVISVESMDAPLERNVAVPFRPGPGGVMGKSVNRKSRGRHITVSRSLCPRRSAQRPTKPNPCSRGIYSVFGEKGGQMEATVQGGRRETYQSPTLPEDNFRGVCKLESE